MCLVCVRVGLGRLKTSARPSLDKIWAVVWVRKPGVGY